MHIEERVTNSKMTKVDRYNWKMADSPGVLRMVDKGDLVVDHTYQRNTNEAKLAAIARAWSWIACGAIVVADRDGTLFVVDGQHRVFAARKRSDISALPCIIFKTQHQNEEAEGFLRGNRGRKPITSVEAFRALVTVGNKEALVVQELLQQAGKTAGEGVSPGVVKCVGVIQKWAQANEPALRRVWPLIVAASAGQQINQRVVEGLLYIETHLADGKSLLDKELHRRTMKIGASGLLSGAAKASAYFSGGGAKVWAAGMIDALNHGCKNRVELTTE